MKILLIIAFAIFVLLIINEIAIRTIYGKFIDDEELEIFVAKHLNEYEFNIKNLWYQSHVPYVSKISFSLFSKWYINDYGRVPRWSKYHKVFEAKNKELTKAFLASYKKKKLSDL